MAQADRQILPDGAGAEQAVGYQMFTAELLLVVAAILLTSARRRPVPIIEAVLTRSAAYLAAFVGNDDPDPRYGDDDERLRAPTGDRRTCAPCVDHLALVGLPAAASGRSRGLAAAWVSASTRRDRVPHVGGSHGRPGPSMPPTAGWSCSAQAGAARHRGRRPARLPLARRARTRRCARRSRSPLDGAAVVDDPGTGSYYGHPAWRTVHRSTRCPRHRDGRRRGPVGDRRAVPVVAARAASACTRSTSQRGVVDAEHDGYQRLDEPVTHRRKVEISPTGDGVVLLVDLRGSGDHRFCLSWPLAPDLTPWWSATVTWSAVTAARWSR